MAISSPLNYEIFHEFSADLAGHTITFFSKPGLPDWDHIKPSTSILAEAIHPKSTDKIINIGCGHGALAVVLGKQAIAASLVVMDNDWIAASCAERTLRSNRIMDFHIPSSITLLPQEANSFTLVALDIPKGRRISQRWLFESYGLLEPGGSLYLAGANDQGIQSIIRDAQELFGNAVIVGYKKGNRCAQLRKDPHRSGFPVWAAEPGIAPGSWDSFELSINNFPLKIFSLPGIFSYNRLDEGTQLLLDSLQLSHQSNILDVGCGYGIIGLYAASQLPSSSIDLIDSNLLAVAAASRNISENHLQNAQAFASDLLDQVHGKQYHLIISNPPFHTGKEVNYSVTNALLHQAEKALVAGGQLILVANRFIRYDYLLKDVFGNSQVLARTNRFHILSATKNA